MVELCGCGHANDHIGSRCRHPVGEAALCPCPGGTRVDLATFRVLVQMNEIGMSQINMTLMRLLAVVETAAGLKSKVKHDGERFTIEVQQNVQKPLIIR